MIKTTIRKKTVQAAWALTMASSLLLVASNAVAEGGFYAGGALGASRVNDSDFDDDDRTIKGFAGGKFNDYIGIEVALHDFGKAEEGIFSSELRGASVAAIGFLPLGKSFDLFLKGGMMHWEDEVRVGNVYNDKLDGEEAFVGVGADIHFTERFALRIEMERYKVELSDDGVSVFLDDSYNVDVASVGGMFSF